MVAFPSGSSYLIQFNSVGHVLARMVPYCDIAFQHRTCLGVAPFFRTLFPSWVWIFWKKPFHPKGLSLSSVNRGDCLYVEPKHTKLAPWLYPVFLSSTCFRVFHYNLPAFGWSNVNSSQDFARRGSHGAQIYVGNMNLYLGHINLHTFRTLRMSLFSSP